MEEVYMTKNASGIGLDPSTATKQDEIKSGLTDVESGLVDVEVAVGSVEDKVANVEDKITDVDTKLGTVNTKLDSLGTKLDSLIAQQCTDLLAGPEEVTVTTSTSTLTELELTLNDNLKKITLIPASSGIYWANGSATAGTNLLPAIGVEIICSKTIISAYEFVVSSGTIKLQVIQEG